MLKSRFFFWLPRILTILSILFMAMFSLDSLGGNEPIMKKLTGLLIHNIPVLIITIALIIAWKREIAGGILLIFLSAAAAIYFRSFAGNPGSLPVIAPFFLEGLLFVLHGISDR